MRPQAGRGQDRGRAPRARPPRAPRTAGGGGAGRRGRALLAGACLWAAGCDWREFDDVLAKAPVLSLGAPEGYAARDVGKVVIPLAVPPARQAAVAARFLVAGTERPSLAVVELDAGGRATTHTASATELASLEAEGNAAVKSAVELEDGRVALGTPSHSVGPIPTPTGRVYLLSLVEGGARLEFRLTRGADPGTGVRLAHGLGVAAGRVGGGPAQDLVVASQDDVTLVEDGNDAVLIPSSPSCPVNLDPATQEKYRFRPLAVGDLVEGGGEEIAVGVPREGTTPGRVVLLSRGAATLDCSVILEAPAPAAPARFGNALLAADVTGDGRLDLLVGAPPLRAYLYPGPFLPGVPPAAPRELKHPTLLDSEATGDFGFRVGLLDLDGAGGPEILVSAPDLAAGGKAGAGQVFVYRPDGSFVTQVGDNSPAGDASFGFSLSALRFTPSGGCGAARTILLVGASREVFTFFRLPNGPPDPRCL